jgi:hypothetical protein
MERQTADKLIHEALQALRARFPEMAVERGSCSYDIDGVNMRFKMTEAGADPAKREFERWAELMGVKPDDYLRAIEVGGTRYALCGLSINRPKFPFIGRRMSDGVKFKLTGPAVKRALGYTEGAQ